MPSLEYDRTFLQAGIPELEKYLLSDEIYWPLGIRALQGEAPFPRMTLGWLLLARERARGWQASGIPPAQSHVIEQLAIRMDAIRTRWRVAWENKARQEFRSRLTLWTNFINEYGKTAADTPTVILTKYNAGLCCTCCNRKRVRYPTPN